MTLEEYVEEKYEYMSETDKNLLVNRAREIYFNQRYPFKSVENRPSVVPENYTHWLCMVVDELVERQNIAGAISYQENGIRFSFDNSTISLGLLNEVKPYAGGFDD